MTLRSRLYHGSVVHSRLRPRAHRLSYRLFWMLLDLDELDKAAAQTRLFSHNRFNAFSIHDTDHGDGSEIPLREQVLHLLKSAGLNTTDLRIELLCMPRVLGYQFNPLSVYFCRRQDGSCEAIIYEVHNTFGERHTYLFRTKSEAPYIHSCAKDFYVSPFLDMDMSYSFHVVPPNGTVSVRIEGFDRNGPLIVASLAGHMGPLSDRALFASFFTCPLVTLKAIGTIHWNALLMLLKGFRLRPHPSKRSAPVSPSRRVAT